MTANDRIAQLTIRLIESTGTITKLTDTLNANRRVLNTTLKTLQDTQKKLETLQKEYNRLREEITQPRCHSCNEELGDNWCADCAGNAGKEQIEALTKRIQELEKGR